ncbi:hypothetical protein SDJN02_27534 [Cucurbita argyrosperma subsp. argyrosperma]|nr:hypothetical protein SDJN02_27534 [Cucurbita argyrosperma subsp. argyrosperma]
MKLRPRKPTSNILIQGNADGDASDEIDVSSLYSDSESEVKRTLSSNNLFNNILLFTLPLPTMP